MYVGACESTARRGTKALPLHATQPPDLTVLRLKEEIFRKDLPDFDILVSINHASQDCCKASIHLFGNG